MRIFLIAICLLIGTLIASSVYANVFVFTYKDTNEVIFITETDNVVISDEEQDKIEKTVLQKNIRFYDLTEAHTDYKLINNRFILNTQKISDRENRRNQENANDQSRRNVLDTAKTKLIGLGFTPAEAGALTK